jgi:hypothetical protein
MVTRDFSVIERFLLTSSDILLRFRPDQKVTSFHSLTTKQKEVFWIREILVVGTDPDADPDPRIGTYD